LFLVNKRKSVCLHLSMNDHWMLGSYQSSYFVHKSTKKRNTKSSWVEVKLQNMFKEHQPVISSHLFLTPFLFISH